MLDRTRTDVLPIQEAVATASPSAWLDAIAVSRSHDVLTVALLDGELTTLTTLATPAAGEPGAALVVSSEQSTKSTHSLALSHWMHSSALMALHSLPQLGTVNF